VYSGKTPAPLIWSDEHHNHVATWRLWQQTEANRRAIEALTADVVLHARFPKDDPWVISRDLGTLGLDDDEEVMSFAEMAQAVRDEEDA